MYQILANRNTPPIPYQITSYKPCMACNISYGIGGVLRFAQIWYIGPPRRADSENIPHKLRFFVPYELQAFPFNFHSSSG